MRSRLNVTMTLVILAAFVAGLAPRHAEAGDIKLAYVDIQRALNECNNGKAVKTDFRGRIQRLQSRLQGEQEDVQRLKNELEQKGPLMQPDQRQNLEDDYTKKLRDFQEDYKNSSDELKQKDNEMTGAIVRDLAIVVEQIGQRNGYTMVMEKGSLLWAIPSIDITDELIRAYDNMNVKAGSLGPRAAASTGNGHFGSAAVPGAAPAAESEPPPSQGSTITK